MYLKLDESKWYKHTYEWSDRSKGIGRVDVYKGQIEVAEDVAPVVHAHWVLYDDNKDVWDCSNCKVHVFVNVLFCKGGYCPNCGAKMDGEVEDD